MVAMQDVDRLYQLYQLSKTEGFTLHEWHEAVELFQKIIERLAKCQKCDERPDACNNDFLNCKIIKKNFQKTIMNFVER